MQLLTATGLYQAPSEGDPESADPNFKSRLRDCGKPECDQSFQTSARWRYFCPKCRLCADIRKPQRQTFSIFRKRRPGGGE